MALLTEDVKYIDNWIKIRESKAGVQDKVIFIKNIPTYLIYDEHENLLPGVKKSQTGDNSFVFVHWEDESLNSLKKLDRYVEMTFPRDRRFPSRVIDSVIPGDMRSNNLPDQLIPKIELPIFKSKEEERITGSENNEVVESKEIKDSLYYCVEDGCEYKTNDGRGMNLHMVRKHNKNMKKRSINNEPRNAA